MRFIALMTVAFFAVAAHAETELKVGDPAPSFQAVDDSGKVWKSSDHVGKKILVVYFYPADMTGGCTAQACGYRDRMDSLKDAGVEVIGVSGDTVENHQVFKKVHDLNFTLLADTDGSVAKQFGVPVSLGDRIVNKLIDGQQTALKRSATAKRWTFVIDRDGKIVHKDDKVRAKQDPETIESVVKRLK
jgi:peroxiredoxin Q/BCP